MKWNFSVLHRLTIEDVKLSGDKVIDPLKCERLDLTT